MTEDPKQLYLSLLKKTLSFLLWPEPPVPIEVFAYKKIPPIRVLLSLVTKTLGAFHLHLVQDRRIGEEKRTGGQYWPLYADTMIGMKRLDNLQACCESAIREGIDGDFIETGVWRGGACIFMRGILAAHGDTTRRVFAADSFEGLPKPDSERYPSDAGDKHFKHKSFLGVSLEEVKENFERYGLLDDQVVFLKGWFKDTLPKAPIEKLSVLRLDGDMYESTMDALTHLYPRLSEGGFCIIDDYGLAGCKQAVDDYRKEHGIEDAISPIDNAAAYWRKEGSAAETLEANQEG